MRAKDKVSIRWQVVFAIISPLNLWAFYRIKKLRKYLLCVFVPSIIVGLVLSMIGYYETMLINPLGGQMGSDYTMPLPPYMTPITPQVGKFDLIPYTGIGIASSIGFALFSVYLIVKWSRQWNGDIAK